MRFLFCTFVLLLVISCKRLDVERRYVSSNNLASKFVGSPDPLKESPPTGEQLWIYWNLPSALYEKGSILSLRLVYKNLDEEVKAYPLYGRKGHQVFKVMGEDYKERGGILTYRADIANPNGEVIETFKQQLWFGQVQHMHQE